ncbi:MAG: hypothetical protein ACOCVM_00440 [Desulfovibrionaceae bacterium]
MFASLRLLALGCVCFALLLPSSAAAGADAPMSIAGITVGEDFTKIESRLDMDTALPLWSQPYLTRARLKPTKGFKSGYVSYGGCARPGKILRVKMKYKNQELQFAQQLAKKITQRYGKPVDFRGNSWGTASAYKWSIPLDKDASVSIILMHSVSDDESYTQGNSLRISVPMWMEQERECYEKKQPAEAQSPAFGPKELTEQWYLPH